MVYAVALVSAICFFLFVGLVLTSPAHSAESEESCKAPPPVIQTVYVDRVLYVPVEKVVYVDKPVEKLVDKVIYVPKTIYETSTVTVTKTVTNRTAINALNKRIKILRQRYLLLDKKYKQLKLLTARQEN